MNVIVTAAHRFKRTPDGTVWTQTNFAYPFWTRYLDVFDSVRVVARVQDTDSADPSWQRANGEQVIFTPIPYYVGPWQYLLKALQVRRAARFAIEPEDAVIFRGSELADVLTPYLQRDGHPFGLEIVGDPYDVFAPGAVRTPLRPLFRWLFPRQLRKQCSKATATAYVTESALQRRYPPAKGTFSTYYSSIELPCSTLVSSPRPLHNSAKPLTLITVGTLAQLYKAQDVIINAVGMCAQEGLDIRLHVVGDGQYRAKLEAQAARLHLNSRVTFLGQLPSGNSIYDQLDKADLFVLPSRQEGLPRAMIEAMARGLPCIGSSVGGIPELLPAEDIVPPDEARALARKIQEVATDPERMERMSQRNLAKAREYCEDILLKRRVHFYQYIRERTEEWLKSKIQ